MKIDQILVQHFYNSKKLRLEGIGNFLLNYNVDAALAADKDVVIPDGAIEFEYDNKATEDTDLISFIVEKTRKIRPLASADLESFTTLGKQFLNIGKPFRLEGIGTLQKEQNGKYEFIPGVFIAPKLDNSPTIVKEKLYDEVSFNAEAKKTGISRKSLLLAGLLAVILAAAGGTWWYFNKSKNNAEIENTTTKNTAATDTSTNKNTADTSTTQKADTLKTPTTPADGYTFKVVFKETTKADAEKRQQQLLSWNYKEVLIAPKDSATYRMMIPFRNPITDTARVLDSLKKHFGAPKAYVIQ